MANFKDIIVGTAGIPATCTITSDESEFTDATPFEIQIEFNKSVTGFVVGDITINNASLSNFAGSGTSYTADVTPDLTDDITISVAADVTNEGNSASNTVTVTDNVPAVNQGWDDLGQAVTLSGTNDQIAEGEIGSKYIKSVTAHSTGYHKFEIRIIAVANGSDRLGAGIVQGSPSQGWLGQNETFAIWNNNTLYYQGTTSGMPPNNRGLFDDWIVSFYVRDGKKVWVEIKDTDTNTFYMIGSGSPDPETDTDPTMEFDNAGTFYAGFTPYISSGGIYPKVELLTTSAEFIMPSRGATAWDT